jgi:hypothetical protein
MACGHRRSRWISVIIAVGLAATGSALAFLWRAFGNNVPTFPSFGSAMEYPHWMVVAGAVLVVAGFIGPWISGYMNREPAKDNQHSAAPPNSSVPGMAEEGEEMSARHSSAKQWKQPDDDQLRDMAASGKGPSEIARLLHRSPSAIRKRASLLGVPLQGW